MKKKLLMGLVSLALSSTLYAENCGQLTVLLQNDTNQPCYLTAQEFVSGFLDSGNPIPSQIDAHTQALPFVISQSIFGPRLNLTFQCGQDSQITFESSQTSCYFGDGTVAGQVLDSFNMAAYSKAQHSSYQNSTAGKISWVLSQQ